MKYPTASSFRFVAVALTVLLLATISCAQDTVSSANAAAKPVEELISPPWPKQERRFSAGDFSPKTEYKSLVGIEERELQYVPSAAEWDLNGDKNPELILSYAHTPGQNKVCYYIFRKVEPGYQLLGKIHHCGLITLAPLNGFAQLEGWASSSEGIYVRALYQMCGDGTYKNTRMDVYKATRFTDDGGPIASSRIFDHTEYPNRCK